MPYLKSVKLETCCYHFGLLRVIFGYDFSQGVSCLENGCHGNTLKEMKELEIQNIKINSFI